MLLLLGQTLIDRRGELARVLDRGVHVALRRHGTEIATELKGSCRRMPVENLTAL